MEITIIENDFSQELFRRNQVFWKYYARKIVMYNLLILLIGIISIITSFSSEHTTTKNVSKSSDGATTITFDTVYKDPVSVGIENGIGVALTLYAIGNSVLFLIRKTKSINSIAHFIGRNHTNNQYSFVLNDQFVIYKTPQMNSECNWTVFLHYKIYQDYLLLFDFNASPFLIPLRKLMDEDLSSLKAFVKSRLAEK